MVSGGIASDAGQASVELVALVPLFVVVALVVLAFLAGHGAREAADQAAVAAAVAQLQGGDPMQAARRASPSWAHPRIRVAHGRVTVTITPNLPGFIAKAIDSRRTVVFDGTGAP
jgi:hypothetical protein